MDKSYIHFGKGCSNQIREDIKNILGVQNEALSDNYLGMPPDVGNSSNGAFKYLKDRVWKRVQGWMEQSLSLGGKEVLIKAVAQAIPTYSMSCFRLPRGLCQHIDGLLRSFWWGIKEGKRRTCWVAWEEMTKPKYLGGLRFRDIEMFNLALLARQAWRLLQEPTSLSARVLKAAYYPDGDFLNANLGSSLSRVWRAIMDGKNVSEQGVIKRVGTGESINIWKTNWLPRDDLFKPVCSKLANLPQYVSELINANSQWDLQLFWEIFIPMDIEVIYSILFCTRRQEDCWAWHYERKGIFSVRSAYRMLIHNREKGSLGLRTQLVNQAINLRRKSGLICRVSKFHQKSEISYGGWLVILCRQLMCAIIDTWPRQVCAHCVVLKIHGSTPYWSATWLDVSGH
jgi:hypothetical protein